MTDGGDPGAPVDPKLKQKAWTTTWVSAIVFAIGYAVYYFHLIPLPNIRRAPDIAGAGAALLRCNAARRGAK